MRIGNYTVVRELARGAMGVVYVARHDELDRDVALKVMLSGGKKIDKGLLKRFELEATTVAQLNHPNIVRVHEVGKDDKDNPYLVMDLIEGESLYHRIKTQGPLPGKDAAGLGKTLAEALEHAHERKILHRDVKPANVLLSPDGEPHLTDFGLARDEGEGADDQRLTHQGQWLGTPGYMPPEQAKGELSKVDRRADVYGLGATLFAMLCGRPPFERETEVETLKAVTAESAPRLSTLQSGIDPELEAICTKCLQKAPEDRYPTAQALAADLDRYLRDEPVEARPARAGDRLGKWIRRNRALVVAALLAVFLLGGAAGAYYGFVLNPEQEAQQVLAAHEAWADEVLEPWALGTLPDRKLPGDAAALEARLQRLDAATDRVGAGTHRQAITLLRAAARLQRGREGGAAELPETPDGKREAAELVVDALLLIDRGKLRLARKRLDLALQRQRGLPAAKLADLHLQARLDPAQFLVRAATLDGDAATLARTLAEPAASALFTETFTQAASDSAPLGRAELRRLSEARQRAGRLGIGEAKQVELKRKALEASAPAWEQALIAAAPRQAELAVLNKLTGLLALEPAVQPGPTLRGLFDQCLLRLLDGEQVAVQRGNTDAAYQRARRIAEVEHTVFYRLDARRRHPLRMHQVLQSSRNAQASASLTPELTLACLRYGVFDRVQSLSQASPGLDRLLDAFPTSRVRRARVWLNRMGRRRARAELGTRSVELLELITGGLDDLSPRYWPELIRRFLTASRRVYTAKQRSLANKALIMLRRSRRALLDSGHRFEQVSLLTTLILEAEATGQARGRSAMLQSLGKGAEFLRLRLTEVPVQDRTIGRELLSRFLVRYARIRGGRFGQREQAVKLCYEALEHGTKALGFQDDWSDGQPACILLLVNTLRSLGRPEEAWKSVERHLDSRHRSDPRMLLLLANLQVDLGKHAEGRALLEQALFDATGERRREIQRAIERIDARAPLGDDDDDDDDDDDGDDGDDAPPEPKEDEPKKDEPKPKPDELPPG